MKKDRDNIYPMTKVALCVSLLSVVSYFALPLPMTPVVLSLQTLAVGIIALILSPGQCAWAMVLYLVMGAVGLPVFSGGTAGVGKLLGPTGGYYFGFLISAVAVSLFKGKDINLKRYIAVMLGIAMPIQHLCAVIMMCIHNDFDMKASFVSVSLPFVVGDIVKGIGAAILAAAINKAESKSKNN
ncbi:MAG: biotin transporter BioY [Clostridia bacterium]|nr:biotin transporter BioY [Clostridia bacterium]MBO7319289.1 biotin transporter BioY [Clostridia bacterium]